MSAAPPLLRPRYQDPWWPQGAFVTVSKDHPLDYAAGKAWEVCHGRLIRCPFTACVDPGFDRGDTKPCNGLAITLRVFDPSVETHLGSYFESDGASYWSVSEEERRKRYLSGDRDVGRRSHGWIVPRPICLSYVVREKRKGYRWCGHKTSYKRCRCRHGFNHLKVGGW